MAPEYPQASYYRARYYDPSRGQFLVEDPFRFFAGEVNFYAYADGNPTDWRDPLGLFCRCTYSQSTGHLRCFDQDTGDVVAEGDGYAGFGDGKPIAGFVGPVPYGKNNPDWQDVPFMGPLPRGDYWMGPTLDRKKTGVMTIMLLYLGGNEPFPPDRSKDMFRIHGDSKKHPGKASEGCIVVEGDVRKKIKNGCQDGGLLTVRP